MESSNGVAAPDPFGSAVADLRAFLAETDREEKRLRHELAVLQVKTKRAKRALDALTDEPKSKAPRSAPGPALRMGRVRMPPEDRQEAVLAALRDGARTVREIAERMEVSPETARKAVYYLRDRELVRMTGRIKSSPNAPTPSETFALMPGGSDDAD